MTVPPIRKYHWWVTKSEMPTTIWVIIGRSGLRALRHRELVEDVHEDRHDDRDDDDHHREREAEDDDRVGHGRLDLAAEGVEALELVGDPIQSLLQAPRALAGPDH